MDIKKTTRKRLYAIRRKAKDGSLTHRLATIATDHHHWYDWGHRVMILIGIHRHGSYEVPRVSDLYLLHDGRRLVTTRDAMTAWGGVRDRNEEWRTFDSQDDGMTVRIGWLGQDGRLHDAGIQGRNELRAFRRWLIWDGWVKAEWFGLRRWVYYKALHAAVHLKKPFACNQTPPRNSGGYNHWHCELRGHHTTHRFRNYTWADERPVNYEPKESVA